MELNEYQGLANATALYHDKDNGMSADPDDASYVEYPVLGLMSEAGELAGALKKAFRDDDGYITDERRSAMIKELGDVLWYVAAIATDLGVTLEVVAKENVAKLQRRMSNGTIHGSGDER